MIRLHNNVSMQNGMNQRLTDKLVCLGPRTSGTGIQDVNNYWTGEVLGDNKADGFTENAYIALTNPHTQETKTFDRFTSPERRGYFSIAFDLAGLEVVTWETEAGDSFIHFYHNVDEAWKTLQLPAGAYSPVVALDFFGSFTERSVDVTLSYLKEGKLYCRFQRERYATDYVTLVDLPLDARIRTAGIMSDWRFGWRFYERIVDNEYSFPDEIPGGKLPGNDNHAPDEDPYWDSVTLLLPLNGDTYDHVRDVNLLENESSLTFSSDSPMSGSDSYLKDSKFYVALGYSTATQTTATLEYTARVTKEGEDVDLVTSTSSADVIFSYTTTARDPGGYYVGTPGYINPYSFYYYRTHASLTNTPNNLFMAKAPTNSFGGSGTPIGDSLVIGKTYHIALVLNADFLNIFIDGVLRHSVRSKLPFGKYGGNLTIGGPGVDISNVRFTAGVARYTKGFLPPEIPYPTKGVS